MTHKPSLDARYPDLLDGQNDPALLDLMQDLDRLYTANSIPVQLTHSQMPQPVHLIRSQDAPIEQSGLFSSTPGPARCWSRVNSLVALLFTVLLAGALAGTFYTLRRTTPAYKVSTPTLGVTPTSGVFLGSQACPAGVATPAYWEPIISPYAYLIITHNSKDQH